MCVPVLSYQWVGSLAGFLHISARVILCAGKRVSIRICVSLHVVCACIEREEREYRRASK